MNIQQIQDLKFKSSDLNKEISIKEYLKTLLLTLWEKEEGFSGKRPFGNSGWKYDVFACLISNRIVAGELDECGWINMMNKEEEKKADKIIIQIIQIL